MNFQILHFTSFNFLIVLSTDGLDFLRSTGKIYSVIAGVIVILVGLFYYLWRLDKKLTKLEKHINNEQ